jgi:hypothetical protein
MFQAPILVQRVPGPAKRTYWLGIGKMDERGDSSMSRGKCKTTQVVLVHSELGTLQVGGALTNAQRGRIPVVLCAGIQPSTRRLNWRDEPYDQGAIVRNCVKWDHEVKANEASFGDHEIHELSQTPRLQRIIRLRSSPIVEDGLDP